VLVSVGVVVLVVVAGAKPHFLPLVFGAGFFGCFLAFFAGHGLLLCGTPPLSAELRTGKAAPSPRQVTNTASFRVLIFNVFTSVAIWLSTPESAAGHPGVTEVDDQSSRPTWRRIETESE
jgi:hypothetical protein